MRRCDAVSRKSDREQGVVRDPLAEAGAELTQRKDGAQDARVGDEVL